MALDPQACRVRVYGTRCAGGVEVEVGGGGSVCGAFVLSGLGRS